jgi:hypothetical protein
VARRGKLGDAVVAHATTNAILTAYVLVCNQWQFWYLKFKTLFDKTGDI